MINREIFTESPEEDLWRELLQYSYRANVSRYLKEHSLDEDEKQGSFLNDSNDAFVSKELKAVCDEILQEVESDEINALNKYMSLSKKEALEFMKS